MGEKTGARTVESVTALGRSVLRFSWAATMFGAQQTVNMIGAAVGAESRASTTEAFDAVASAIEGQFGGVFRGAYRTAVERVPGLGPRTAGTGSTRS